MNVFEAVKQSVTTRQAAEHYGIHVGRNGMACCPFHHDKTPSMKLTYDIAPAARLIDLDEYKIAGGEMLYGFVAGLMASNYDITDLYIDGILKVLDHDINRLGAVLDEMAAIAGDSVKVTVTVSADEAALPHDVKKYL